MSAEKSPSAASVLIEENCERVPLPVDVMLDRLRHDAPFFRCQQRAAPRSPGGVTRELIDDVPLGQTVLESHRTALATCSTERARAATLREPSFRGSMNFIRRSGAT